MLVLTRRLEESIQIGPDITVTVLRIGASQVAIGIDAPRDVQVLRDNAKRKAPADPSRNGGW